jgi:uncharacterized phage protein (TIGR01671 family)
MKREILFRGKKKAGDYWICGDLRQWSETRKGILDYSFGGTREVYPETVGQYTGLTDKNGKKIFEGDIVRILGNQSVEDWKNVNYNALIAFLDGGFCAIDGTIEDHAFRRYALARMDFDLEVIGNIHDNPELLDG